MTYWLGPKLRPLNIKRYNLSYSLISCIYKLVPTCYYKLIIRNHMNILLQISLSFALIHWQTFCPVRSNKPLIGFDKLQFNLSINVIECKHSTTELHMEKKLNVVQACKTEVVKVTVWYYKWRINLLSIQHNLHNKLRLKSDPQV